jgi:hypothetical protein
VRATGAYAIESRSGRNGATARNQAIANAVWVREKFGQRWVTAILCVGDDPPSQPVKQGHAWVLGTADLERFLRKPTLGRGGALAPGNDAQ